MASAAQDVVLVVGPDDRDHADLGAMLNLAGYRALTKRTVRQTIGLPDSVSAVICEDILPDGAWKDILAALDRVHSPPALIVTSTAVEPRLWAEVLNLGGSDVLAQPFSSEEVLWIVQHARPAKRTLPERCELEHPATPNPEPSTKLPENGHQCALMDTDWLAFSKKPCVSRLSHLPKARSSWTGDCSPTSGSQRSTLKR